MKGSMTVETACVIPFCWLMIGIISCLGLYQYNQAVLKISAYECLIQTEGDTQASADIYKKVLKERAAELGSSRALAVKEMEAEVKVTATKVSITYRGIQAMFNLPIELTVTYERTFPELTLRLLSVEGTGESE